jgi:hypothetical protein
MVLLCGTVSFLLGTGIFLLNKLLYVEYFIFLYNTLSCCLPYAIILKLVINQIVLNLSFCIVCDLKFLTVFYSKYIFKGIFSRQ